MSIQVAQTDFYIREDGSVEIPLANSSKVALVDAEDVELVNQYGWYMKGSTRGRRLFYAASTNKNSRNKEVRMHRLILGAPDGLSVDHINHDGLDNRKVNLRLATQSENIANSRIPSNNSSGFKGVSLHEGIWQSIIQYQQRKIYLGLFADPEDAARAYDTAARYFFGEFAYVNFPDDEDTPEALEALDKARMRARKRGILL